MWLLGFRSPTAEPMYCFSCFQALVVSGLRGAVAPISAAISHNSRLDGACPCMGCRQNLKKEKRLRNRVNAFRFKKSSA